MNFGQMSKVANSIRRAIAKHFSVKAGTISFKLCCAIAKNGGNETTVINAMNYNEAFKRKMLSMKTVATNLFRYYINDRFMSLIFGENETQVRKSIMSRLKVPNVNTIAIEPVR